MITQEDSKMDRKRRRLEVAQALIGVAVIVAVFTVLICGIDAFRKDENARLAMRLPLLIAGLLVCSFAWSSKLIVKIAAVRHQGK